MNQLESWFAVLETAKAKHFVGTGQEHQIFAEAVMNLARTIQQLLGEKKQLADELDSLKNSKPATGGAKGAKA